MYLLACRFTIRCRLDGKLIEADAGGRSQPWQFEFTSRGARCGVPSSSMSLTFPARCDVCFLTRYHNDRSRMTPL
jgi:hypothetical protein